MKKNAFNLSHLQIVMLQEVTKNLGDVHTYVSRYKQCRRIKKRLSIIYRILWDQVYIR